MQTGFCQFTEEKVMIIFFFQFWFLLRLFLQVINTAIFFGVFFLVVVALYIEKFYRILKYLNGKYLNLFGPSTFNDVINFPISTLSFKNGRKLKTKNYRRWQFLLFLLNKKKKTLLSWICNEEIAFLLPIVLIFQSFEIIHFKVFLVEFINGNINVLKLLIRVCKVFKVSKPFLYNWEILLNKLQNELQNSDKQKITFYNTLLLCLCCICFV